MGGGNAHLFPLVPRAIGLSPRGRGKLEPGVAQNVGQGSIPAWAGETDASFCSLDLPPVYPRVGGGNLGGPFVDNPLHGLSPRGRGKRPATFPGCRPCRSIPAWAGETTAGAWGSSPGRVYPRVGGGNPVSHGLAGNPYGLSPRGRGKLLDGRGRLCAARSIPAWAGETGGANWTAWPQRVYPRVGGGNSSPPNIFPCLLGLSPRGRGKPQRPFTARDCRRSIPAWAGETSGGKLTATLLRVYPRVGGGNVGNFDIAKYIEGLSPRGRGKPQQLIHQLSPFRSIPAWAGETARRLWSARPAQVYPRVGGGNLPRL